MRHLFFCIVLTVATTTTLCYAQQHDDYKKLTIATPPEQTQSRSDTFDCCIRCAKSAVHTGIFNRLYTEDGLIFSYRGICPKIPFLEILQRHDAPSRIEISYRENGHFAEVLPYNFSISLVEDTEDLRSSFVIIFSKKYSYLEIP